MAIKPTIQQERVMRTLDRPLFVSAGAGSGKSSTLAERVAWAFQPGSGPDGKPYLSSLDEVLIITFTHAAADEIRDKVRAKLQEAGLVEEALRADSAWISTIHGMCARILRRHALELGIDPEFRMIPGTVQDEMLEAATEGVLRRLVDDAWFPELTQAFEVGLRRGRSNITIRAMAERIRAAAASSSRGFETFSWPGEVPDARTEVSRYQQALERLIATGQELGAFGSDTGQKALEDLSRAAEELARACEPTGSRRKPTAGELAELLGSLPAPKANYGNKEFKEHTFEAQEVLARTHMMVQLAALAPHADALVQVAERIQYAYDALKHAEGYLDNDDLLTQGLAALRDHPDIAALYGDAFRLVMIDEFQDTNAQQVEMISLLSGVDACHLATVGDAQQSIYRFRAADVTVFRERESEMPEEGIVKLDMNFRSHADVLAFVAACLAGGALNGFMPLAPCPTRRDTYVARSLPRASLELVSGTSAGSSKVSAALMREVMAARIAARLRAFADAGESPDNMVLLLGRMSHVEEYLSALRAQGLDCVVDGGSTFAQAPEVGVVASLLDFLANPKDTQAGLYHLLASDMFGVQADDLVALATKVQEANGAPAKRRVDVGLWDFSFVEGVEPSERLVRARDVLVRAVRRMGSWEVPEVLMGVVRESGWLARLEAGGASGRAQAANVLAAIRYVRALVQDTDLGTSMAAYEFRHWLDVSKEGPASLAGAEGGAVHVMTIHASKGLEFPVVAVAECWRGSQSGGGVVAENIRGRALATLLPPSPAFPDEPPMTEADCHTRYDWANYLHFLNMEGDDDEAARLLYVALTRAREAVVLGMPVSLSKKGASGSRVLLDVFGTLFGGGVPDAGATELAYDYEFEAPGANGLPEPCRTSHVASVSHVAMARTKDGVQVDSGGLMPELDGLHPADWHPAEALEDASAQDEERTFELFAQDVEDGLAEAGTAMRPWPGRGGVFSYSSAHAVLDEAGELPERIPYVPQAENWDETQDAELAPQLDDADRATDLGSAFHELAQVLVETGGRLTPDQVVSMERYWGLSTRQKVRLEDALARWRDSAIRAEALSHARVQAEVPFFCDTGETRFGNYVEGFIDLLATDPGSTEALVVDYKTGDAGLSPEQVWQTHEMQANFYAWVLMGQGFERVRCAFVCVEREAAEGGPFVARYEFDADHRPELLGA